MKVKDLKPNLEHLSELEFLDNIDIKVLFYIFNEIGEYYNNVLPLWRVLNYYGIDNIDENTESGQVNCLLVEHGSNDVHRSAKYFFYDRETGNQRPAVYCYKCSKLLTSFWYVFRYEKDHHGLQTIDIFKLIYNQFWVKFPRELILEFDYETYFSFENVNKFDFKFLKSVKTAKILRETKELDKAYYLSNLKKLLI